MDASTPVGENTYVRDGLGKWAKEKGRGKSIGLGVPFDFNSKVVSQSEYFNTITSIPPKIWAWRLLLQYRYTTGAFLVLTTQPWGYSV